MAKELSRKVAIITGGASGIGRASVELFIKEGAKVVIADIDKRGKDLADELGENARFKKTDVSNEDEVKALVNYAVKEFGGLHIMFNNAGVSTAMHSRFFDDEFKDFHKSMDVNVLGVVYGSKHAGLHMSKNGGGSIINTASTASQMAGYGVLTYRMAKAAMLQFSKSIAIDLGEYGIRVNCIAPGNVQTEMTNYADPSIAPEVADEIGKAAAAVLMEGQPLKRKTFAKDCAQAAVFLASDRSRQVTGMMIPIDGGIMAGDPVNHLEQIMKARAKALEG